MAVTLGATGQEDGERQGNSRLPRRDTSLRRRVTAAILTAVAAAVVVFAVPLAYAVRQLYRNEELTGLQRDAVRIAALVPDTPPEAAAGLPQRPAGLPSDVRFGVYDASGRRLAGDGPEQSALAASAADGRTHALIDASYAAAAPVPSDGVIAVTVLATSTGSAVADRTRRAWSVMAVLAVAILGGAAFVARLQARRLAQPLERLTAAARALGDGQFTINSPRSGIVEVDDAGAALVRTAARLGQVRERERSFARDVSHQLRTPLAGLLLGLENALDRDAAADRAALRKALERGRRLETIIDDLLALTRPGAAPPSMIDEVLADTQERWHGVLADRGRRLVVRIPPRGTPVDAPAAALRQIVDVLVDNALRHGEGTVTVEAVDVADGAGVTLTVADEGRGLPGRRTDGVGLPLATTLAAAAGALLALPEPGASPVFRLLIPAGPGHQLSAS